MPFGLIVVKEKVMAMKIRTYSELIKFRTFEERYRYLRLFGVVGKITFGYDRYINQLFYNCGEWKRTRRDIIIRDNGCDLGVKGYELEDRIIIHHMNPITIEDIEEMRPEIFDPELLISSSDITHKAIHYSDESLLPQLPITRSRYDTCPWRR
jgi:hypothetical protein